MNYVIFLSPSEDKVVDEILDSNKLDFLESLWIKNNKTLLKHRQNTYRIYNNYLEKIINENDRILLKEIFGATNLNANTTQNIYLSLRANHYIDAILRYSGVAFKALDFKNLDSKAQRIILEKTYIFSNFFGVISASDKIPYYKLKQGCKANFLSLAEIYKPFIPILESFLAKLLQNDSDFIIDLRANIYTKIFKPKQNSIFFEFYKQQKIVSHFSKFYRGKILRILASEFLSLDSNITLQKILNFLTNLKTSDFIFTSSIIKDNKIILKYEIL